MTPDTGPPLKDLPHMLPFDGTIDWPVIGGAALFILTNLVGYVRLHLSHGALQEKVSDQQEQIEASTSKLTDLQNTVLIEQTKREGMSDSLEKLEGRMSARFDKIESVVQDAVNRMLDALSIPRSSNGREGRGPP